MTCQIAVMLKKLKRKFPDAHVAIGVDYDICVNKENIEIEYTVYVHNDFETYHQQCTSLRDVEKYVEALVERLTANQVLNAGGSELQVD